MINVSINCQSTLRLIIHSKGSEKILKQGFSSQNYINTSFKLYLYWRNLYHFYESISYSTGISFQIYIGGLFLLQRAYRSLKNGNIILFIIYYSFVTFRTQS